MKIYTLNLLFMMMALTMLPQCKSTENRFTVSPDQPLTQFELPIDKEKETPSGPTLPTSPSTTGSDNLNISSEELKAFMVSEGNPSEWSSVSFEKVVKIAEFFCSDCHTSSVWYGDSTTREFYSSRNVRGRVEGRTMPSPATSYSNLMDEAEAAGYDYRAAMIRYLSN